MANQVTIPEKHYVGMIKRENDQLPLGFITPWGEDQTAKKRMATVDSWAGYNSNYNGTQTSIKPIVIDNIPLSGFKLSGNIRTSDYGGENKWRIIDPRGFELEITSGNLAKLLSVGVFDQGELMDQCVWGRKGANNILLSTSSEEYKLANENTVISKQSASWSDVKLGDTVILQNNIRGVFLGRMFMFTNDYDYHQSNNIGVGENQFTSSSKSIYVIHNDKPTQDYYSHELHLISSPKLSSIIKADKELTPLEAELLANELLHGDKTYLVMSGYKTVIALTFNSLNPTNDYTLTKIKKVITSKNDLLNSVKNRRSDVSVFVDIDSKYFGQISSQWNQEFRVLLHSIDHLKLNEYRTCNIYSTDSTSGYYHNHNNYKYVARDIKYEYNSNDEFFNLELCIKTKNGNEFKHLV